MTLEEVDSFEKCQTQVEALCTELTALSKKKPDDGVNLFKLGLINKVLVAAAEVLGETYVPFGDFTTFDEDSVPTNSDVALVLSQYLNCMEKLRSDHVVMKSGNWYWDTGDEGQRVRTKPPNRISK